MFVIWLGLQCRQEDTIVGQSPGAQAHLKIKLKLGFTTWSMQSIVNVGGLEDSLLNRSLDQSSLGLNCIVQTPSLLANGGNRLGSFKKNMFYHKLSIKTLPGLIYFKPMWKVF